MNNYKITFKDLRTISDALQKDRGDIFLDYINSFQGNNTFQKFRNILTVWENDVSPHLTFKLKGNSNKVGIRYLLTDMAIDADNKVGSSSKYNLKFEIGIPTEFTSNEDIVPIYSVIKSVELLGQYLKLDNVPLSERKKIIDSFPADMYTLLLNSILSDKSKVLSYTHPALSNFKLNFLTNDALYFLKHMFMAYDDFYFRDIVYYLSPKLGSNLESSTMLDIEYYIKKLETETSSDNNDIKL